MSTKISETCACGGSIDVEASDPAQAIIVVRRWRQQHYPHMEPFDPLSGLAQPAAPPTTQEPTPAEPCPTERDGLCWCIGIGIPAHRTSLAEAHGGGA